MPRGALDAQARLQSSGVYRFLSGERVVVVVGNYRGTDGLTRESVSSACTSGFATRVEAKSPPKSRYRRQYTQGKSSIKGVRLDRSMASKGSDSIDTSGANGGKAQTAALIPGIYGGSGGEVRQSRGRHSLVPTPCAGACHPCLRMRCLSRFQSRSFSVARLSWSFLPLARPISTLTRAFFQYMARGTRV